MTATELQVLRLMCADKSNAEIGRILDIKLPTVKTHVSHILTKLNVSRRSEAKTAARRLWLVE
jgi:LuxR family maltose regulon positive regulatory protein